MTLDIKLNKKEYRDLYNDLLKLPNPEEAEKVKGIYQALETRINIRDKGPNSFRSLLSLSDEQLQYFKGKTIFQAITEAEDTKYLRILKDYGRILRRFGRNTVDINRVNPYLEEAGDLINNLSVAQAYVKFKEGISTLDLYARAESLKKLTEKPYIVDSVKEILKGGFKHINNNLLTKPIS